MAQQWVPPESFESLMEEQSKGNKFAGINSPTAGARTQATLPVGKAAIQYYSLGTPNGIKPAILLEELGIEYNAHRIDIMKGDQFTSGFVEVNPNSKIPALVDKEGPDGKPINVFESGAILFYLAEKYKKFLPTSASDRVQVMNWVFWQMAGQGPMAGNLGHFFVYAPNDKCETRDYGVARYGMETLRLASVLDVHLAGKTFIVGEQYTIADIAILPWFQQLRTGYAHPSGRSVSTVLGIETKFPNAIAWANRLLERPAVQKGIKFVYEEDTRPVPKV